MTSVRIFFDKLFYSKNLKIKLFWFLFITFVKFKPYPVTQFTKGAKFLFDYNKDTLML